MPPTSSLLETLEDRTLFSDASLTKGVLHVNANPTGGASVITVANSANHKSLDVTIKFTPRAGVVKTFKATFANSVGVKQIVVRGGGGADTISIGSDASPITLPARINGLAGNDTITGGAGDDVIDGGLGNDTLYGGKGNDVVYGRRGADHLFGNAGNDALWGGLGADEIDGGAGNDRLGGILGSNKLIGGAGADEFLVRSLAANPTNDYTKGKDKLTIVGKTDGDDGDTSSTI